MSSGALYVDSRANCNLKKKYAEKYGDEIRALDRLKDELISERAAWHDSFILMLESEDLDRPAINRMIAINKTAGYMVLDKLEQNNRKNQGTAHLKDNALNEPLTASDGPA